MTKDELVDRARRYTVAALERLAALEAQVPAASEHGGLWRSLRANIESAAADLTEAVKASP